MTGEALEQHKLAAIMFTDMAGYRALAQRNETLELELLEDHQRLLRAILRLYNGLEIETAGDACLAEFASALEATRCAVEIQRALAERDPMQPSERCIPLRIGIHVGDVVHKDAKVMGDAVNIAARIERLAEPGGICVTRPVWEQVHNKLDQPLVRIGAAELKNIELPMEVYRVSIEDRLAAAGSRRATPRCQERGCSDKTRRRSRAILGLAVLLLVALNVWLFLKFGLRASSATPSKPRSPTKLSTWSNSSLEKSSFSR